MANFYTPTPDEFYNGFEYYFDTDRSTIFHNDFDETGFDYSLTKVKLLDVNDIIDLGFTIRSTSDGITHLFKNVPSNQPKYFNLFFESINDLPHVTITDMRDGQLVFKLHLKNKSELKWILNRYGIL